MSPTDEQILEQLIGHGICATYVIKNRLRTKKFEVRTSHVLQAMRRLEAQGRVQLDPYCNKNNYRWRYVG